MIKFNYILNDLALSILITKCLHSENANYSDKEELENQIKLIQQENKRLNQKYLNAVADYEQEKFNVEELKKQLEDILNKEVANVNK